MPHRWEEHEHKKVINTYLDELDKDRHNRRTKSDIVNEVNNYVDDGDLCDSISMLMQNLSHILIEMGHPCLDFFKPRPNVGPTFTGRVHRIVRERQGKK